MNFRILHISDIHFGPRCRYRPPDHATPLIAGRTAAENLSEDLTRHGYKSDIRAIVVSGDLTWENKPEEFAAAGYFLEHLSTRLDVPLDNVVVIPGNHDITWSEADTWTARRFHNLVQHHAESGFRSFYTGTLKRRVSGYLIDARIFPQERVVIVGFNSCRLSNKRDAGLGYVGRSQVEQAIRDLRNDATYKASADEFFKIAVLHHHLLPMVDLSMGDLDKPPAERRFSLTVDAKLVLDLLLADNFALVLHGHQHQPFCAVERRLAITETNPPAPPDTQIAIAAAGSLYVAAPHATHNQFQVIDLEEKAVKIAGVEMHWDDPTQVKYQKFTVVLERHLLAHPISELRLGDYGEKLLDDLNKTLEDSDQLAENVCDENVHKSESKKNTDFLRQIVKSLSTRIDALAGLGSADIEELIDAALDSWLILPAPMKSYREDGAKALLSFPEYIVRLMGTIDARRRGTREA